MTRRLRSLAWIACAALGLATTGCIPAAVGIVAATSGGGGGGGGGGGSSAPAARPFSVSFTAGQSLIAGETAEVLIAPGGPVLGPVGTPGGATAPMIPEVSVEGARSPQITILAPDRFRFVVPQNPRGNLSVTLTLVITLPGWRAEVQVNYRALPPTIANVTPEQISAGGGTLVAVSGAGFAPGTVVAVGSQALTPSSLNDDYLSFVAPQAPVGTRLDLTVRHPEGFEVTRVGALLAVRPSLPLPLASPPTQTIRQGELAVATIQLSVPTPDGAYVAASFVNTPYAGLKGRTVVSGSVQVSQRMNEVGTYSLRYHDPRHDTQVGFVDLGPTLEVVPWHDKVTHAWRSRWESLASAGLGSAEEVRSLSRQSDALQVLYAGGPAGLWWSPDEGAQWTERALPGAPAVREVLGGSGGRVHLATNAGVLRSDDEGQTWVATNAGLGSSDVLELAFGPSGSLVASTAAGVYSSNDAGASWSAAAALPATPGALACATASATTYVAVGAEVHRSRDGGQSWARIDSGFDGTLVTALACDASGNEVAAGTAAGAVYRSSDGGDNWSPGEDPSGHGRPVRDLAALPRRWLSAVEGQGVFLRGPQGWEARNGTLGDRRAWALSVAGEARWALAVGKGGVATTQEGGLQGPWQLLESYPTTPKTLTGSSIAVHLSESGEDLILYADALKSSDAGQSWFSIPLTGNSALLEGNRNRLFTEQGLASDDGGGSWHPLRLPSGETPASIGVGAGSRVYTQSHYSADWGLTWTKTVESAVGSLVTTESPAAPNRVYGLAYNRGNGRLYVDDTRGQTWQNSFPAANLLEVLADPSDATRLLGVFASPGQPAPLSVSTTGGRDWRLLSPPTPNLSNLQWDRGGARVYATPSFSSSFHSLDGGTTWAPYTGGQGGTEALRRLALRGGHFDDTQAAMTATGLYLSSDRGGTWNLLTPTIPSAFNGKLVVARSNPSRWYLFDRGSGTSMYRSDNAGRTWTTASYPGGAISVDVADADRLYAGIGSLSRSDDGGASWVAVPTAPGATTYVADPCLANRVWVTTNPTFLVRSDDAGVTWTQLSLPSSLGANRIRFPAGQPNMVLNWNGVGPTAWKSLDGGVSWLSFSVSGATRVTSVYADSGDPLLLYAAGDTYTGSSSQPNYLYRSRDGGASWVLATSLPILPSGNRPVSLFPSPYVSGRVLADTDFGLVLSDDGGDTWRSAGAGIGAGELAFAGVAGRYALLAGRAIYLTTNAAFSNPNNAPTTFTTSVWGLLQADCMGCHANGTSGFFANFDQAQSYQSAFDRTVRVANQEHTSELLRKASQSVSTSHSGGTVWPEGGIRYQRVLEWIKDGAPLK